MCLHRLWQVSHICMCWATAFNNLQHCSRQSSFCRCTPTTSMGKVSVAYETSWNLLLFLCWSLCYQSSAPCKEIKSLQDILINCWQDICSFFWIFWWDCIWNECIPSMSHRCRLHNEYITGIPQRRPKYQLNNHVIDWWRTESITCRQPLITGVNLTVLLVWLIVWINITTEDILPFSNIGFVH